MIKAIQKIKEKQYYAKIHKKIIIVQAVLIKIKIICYLNKIYL